MSHSQLTEVYMREDTTPYYVECGGDSVPGQERCGSVNLTEEQYLFQLNRPNRGWECPQCGSSASFDDAKYEKGLEARDNFINELIGAPVVSVEVVHVKTDDKWTNEQARQLCVKLEPIAARCRGHVALTGGCLYKDGPRKDLDILIYRERQHPEFAWDLFFREAAREISLIPGKDYGWVKKATLHGKRIDFFDPDAASGEHTSG